MQGAAILIDEAPPAAQDLFGRGSYRIRIPGPAVKAGKIKTAEQRLHESDFVAHVLAGAIEGSKVSKLSGLRAATSFYTYASHSNGPTA